MSLGTSLSFEKRNVVFAGAPSMCQITSPATQRNETNIDNLISIFGFFSFLFHLLIGSR